MSSDSSSPAAHNEPAEETVEEALVFKHLCDFFNNTLTASDDSALFETAAQHLSLTLSRQYTAGEVAQQLQIAKSKRRRRKNTESAAHRKLATQQAELAEHEAQLSAARTRRQREQVLEVIGPEPAPPRLSIRTASTVTSHACALLTAIESLRSRSKPPSAKKSKREKKDETASDPAVVRAPLQDVSNQQATSQPAADSLSSRSTSDTDDAETAPAASNSSVTVPPTNIAAAHSLGLLTPQQRISIKQKKRDLKKAIADSTAQQVVSELEARQRTARMVDEATVVLSELKQTIPIMRQLMEQAVRKRGGSETESR